jgi:hypothetical protein
VGWGHVGVEPLRVGISSGETVGCPGLVAMTRETGKSSSGKIDAAHRPAWHSGSYGGLDRRGIDSADRGAAAMTMGQMLLEYWTVVLPAIVLLAIFFTALAAAD